MANLAILMLALSIIIIISTASVTEARRQCGDKVQRLNACQRYLREGCKCECQRKPQEYECSCITEGPLMMRGQGGSCIMRLKECCNEIESMEGQCRCDGITKVVQSGEEEMVEEATKLPQTCGLTPTPCTIQSFWF